MRARAKPIVPGPGQESVWDYPRPPRIEATNDRIKIRFGGELIVDTSDVVRVLETSHPPVYYLRRDAYPAGSLLTAPGSSFCEYKGAAKYLSVAAGGALVESAAWYYPTPSRGYELLVDRLAVYPAAMDYCEVNGERVTPQAGGFYGGWINSWVVGPFKGEPGTLGW